MICESKNYDFVSLAGKMLIANPYCSFGDIFDKSIIYIATHSSDGSLGLIVNKSISKLGLKKLYSIKDDKMPEVEKNIFIGGPIEPERGFVLHSSEYGRNIIFEKMKDIAVSSNMEVISDILKGKGPTKSSIILGYTGWGAGQLENEIKDNYWLILDSDPSIIFGEDNNYKWETALEKAGVDNRFFSSSIGNC